MLGTARTFEEAQDDYFTAAALQLRLIRAVHALPAPPGDEETVDRMIGDWTQAVQAFTDVIGATLSDDQEATDEAVARVVDEYSQVKRAAQSLGATECLNEHLTGGNR